MIKYAWIAKVKKGCLEEYIRRHDQIWQEMKDVLKEASIRNYTIWTDGEQLFGYYECEKGTEHALKVQKERTGAPYAETVRRAIMAFLQAQTPMADPSDASRDRSPA